MLIGSTNSLTPCDTKTWSPDPWPFSSIIRPYWKPEHPPPCTNTRKPPPAFCSSTSSSLIFDAAVSDTLIMTLRIPIRSDRPTAGNRLGHPRFAGYGCWQRTGGVSAQHVWQPRYRENVWQPRYRERRDTRGLRHSGGS